MAPPTPKSCYVTGCEFSTTVGLPNYEMLMRDLELHTRYAHPEIPAQGANEVVSQLDPSQIASRDQP